MILAGGQSSRMGRDKACISVNGVPMLRRVYDVAACCTPHIWVVTPRPRRYQALLPDQCHWIMEPPLSHALAGSNGKPVKTHGPLVGFAHGLTHLAHHDTVPEWVFLLACDLPCLDNDIVQGWTDLLPSVPQEAIALLPQRTQGWETLCGFYRSSCLGRLQQFIDGGGRSFHRWLNGQRVEPLHLADDRAKMMMMNCNTPADLENLDMQEIWAC